MSGGPHTHEDFTEELNDLVQGLQKETTLRDFYLQGTEQVSDPRAKALYGWLASSANVRIGKLDAVRSAAVAAQAWAQGIDEQIKAADAQSGDAPAFVALDPGKPGRAEVTTLRQAIELEKEAASVYFTAIQRSRDPNVRAFYRLLASSEEKHIKLLELYFDGFLKALMHK